MKSDTPSNADGTDPVAEEALRWVIRRLDASSWTAQDEVALRAWRTAAPEHEAAFQRHASVVERMSRREIFGEAVRRRATTLIRGRRFSRRRFAFGALAAAVVIVVGFSLHWRTQMWTREFRTTVARRQEIELPDGTQVTLDAMTRLACVFDANARQVNLLSGAATFHVARDASRPFEVVAGAQAVRDVGTFFEVKYTGDPRSPDYGIGVAVTEGSVDVRTQLSGNRWSEPIRLSAGQATRWSSGDSSTKITTVSPKTFAAWRRGLVLCDGERLEAVVADLQRYSRERIELTDPSLGELRVSGTLPVDDIDAAAQLLESVLPVRVRRFAGDRIVVEAAASGRSGP